MSGRGFQTLTLRVDPRGVATLDVDRPLDEVVTDELLWAFALLAADQRVRVIVLAPHGAPTAAPPPALRDVDLTAVMGAIDACPKPVIGRIDKDASTAGIWLCSVCDVVLSSTQAHSIEGIVAAHLMKASDLASETAPDRAAKARPSGELRMVARPDAQAAGCSDLGPMRPKLLVNSR